MSSEPLGGRKEHSSQVLNAPDQQQLDRAVALVRDVLDSDTVATYLFGSAVLGGLRVVWKNPIRMDYAASR